MSCWNSLPWPSHTQVLRGMNYAGRVQDWAGQERGDGRAGGGSPGLAVGRREGHWLTREVQAWKTLSKEFSHPFKSQTRQSRFWKLIKYRLYWISQSGPLLLRSFHSSICPCQKNWSLFPFAIFPKCKSQGGKERSMPCNCSLLTGLSSWQCPKLLSNTPVINFTKDPLPRDNFFSNTLACQDKECFFAESKSENVGVQRGREETTGADGKALKKLVWGRPKKGFKGFHWEIIEALSRDLEAVFEGSCVVFQAQHWNS